MGGGGYKQKAMSCFGDSFFFVVLGLGEGIMILFKRRQGPCILHQLRYDQGTTQPGILVE